MEIWYLGKGAFRLRTQESLILINPYDKKKGLKLIENKAQIFLFNQERFGYQGVQFDQQKKHFLIQSPGEYEIGNISIFAQPTALVSPKERNLAFLIEAEKLKIAHLGQLSLPPKEEVLNYLNSPEILFLPVDSISHQEALKIAKQLEAKIIIPIVKTTASPKEEDTEIKKFLETSSLPFEKKEKLLIKKKDIGEEEKIVVIERRGEK